MSIRFETPSLTTLASLEAIVRNVSSAVLQPEPHSLGRERTVYVELVGSSVRWCHDGKCMVLPRLSIAALDVVPLRNAGERFVAIVLTYHVEPEPLRYRMITSHESEAAWLKESAERIGQLLGLPVAVGV